MKTWTVETLTRYILSERAWVSLTPVQSQLITQRVNLRILWRVVLIPIWSLWSQDQTVESQVLIERELSLLRTRGIRTCNHKTTCLIQGSSLIHVWPVGWSQSCKTYRLRICLPIRRELCSVTFQTSKELWLMPTKVPRIPSIRRLTPCLRSQGTWGHLKISLWILMLMLRIFQKVIPFLATNPNKKKSKWLAIHKVKERWRRK